MDHNKYQKTGNNIPIPVDELVAYVQERLNQYDMLTQATEAVPSYNPYTHPIIYPREDGKTVQIPEDIQKQAVGIYLRKKRTGDQQPSQQLSQQPSQYLPQQPSQHPPIIKVLHSPPQETGPLLFSQIPGRSPA